MANQNDDESKLLMVEELIHLALGPTNKNTVNFKIIQSILFIMAKHTRLLEQRVELKIDKFADGSKKGGGSKKGSTKGGAMEVVSYDDFASVKDKVGGLMKNLLPGSVDKAQLLARVEALENDVKAIVDLIGEIVECGNFSPEIVAEAKRLHAKIKRISVDQKSLAKSPDKQAKQVFRLGIDPVVMLAQVVPDKPPNVPKAESPEQLTETTTRQQASSPTRQQHSNKPRNVYITYGELEDAMERLKDDVMAQTNNMIQWSYNAIDKANARIDGIMEDLETSKGLDNRICGLRDMIDTYSTQLANFDSCLETQMCSFKEQMSTIRADLQSGLTQLEQVNNNAETAAILELTKRYEDLVAELDSTLHATNALDSFQKRLAEELQFVSEAVELMREQKVDREEVEDGLKDKVDKSRLKGLMLEAEFDKQRAELERDVQVCYDKFKRQDSVWMRVINDLSEMVNTKAEEKQLKETKKEIERRLQEILKKVQYLAKVLGEPKAAILSRELSVGGTCAVCGDTALMDAKAEQLPLPPARPVPPGYSTKEEACLVSRKLQEIAGEPEAGPQRHRCLRWVGGSHTLVGAPPGRGHVTREEACAALSDQPLRRYTGEGNDGKTYLLSEVVAPCVECNVIYEADEKLPDAVEGKKMEIPGPATDGAGDGGPLGETSPTSLDTPKGDKGPVREMMENLLTMDEFYPSLHDREFAMRSHRANAEIQAKNREVKIGGSVRGTAGDVVAERLAAKRAALAAAAAEAADAGQGGDKRFGRAEAATETVELQEAAERKTAPRMSIKIVAPDDDEDEDEPLPEV